jgi:hypothetical protein
MSLLLVTERFCTPFTSEGCGNGVCNDQGTTCTCAGDYIFDYTQVRFPLFFRSYVRMKSF